MKQRIISAILLAAMMIAGLISCAEAADEKTQEAADVSAANEEETEAETEITPDIPSDLKFDGASFVFGTVENPNARNSLIMEEITGEVLNDAQYQVIENTSDALDVAISQNVMTKSYPAAAALIPFITAGDDEIQVANVFCVDATTLMSKGYIQDYDRIDYIDLEKPWWDSKVNDSLVFAGMRYAAIGDLSISTHDLTYALVFNKAMIEDNTLDNPYELISSGKWTMDKMSDMMVAVLNDVNGNGKSDKEDVCGYVAANKMILPGFWIGAGERTIELDEEGIPALAVTDERFIDVFNKVFEITYDNNAHFVTATDMDVPTDARKMFTNNQSLFMDCSLFYVEKLRDMDTDFGVIVYPKFDENQSDYHSRVSYYMPPVIPMSTEQYTLIGAVLEMSNYYASRQVRPAYYEICLKGKYARDEESIEMLDVILGNRVVDLGDTLFCADIRDGFMVQMYDQNNRDIVSTAAKKEKGIDRTITKMVEAVMSPAS